MMSNDPPDPNRREVLTDWQRATLCQLLRSLRRGDRARAEWDMPGIEAAVRKAEETADDAAQLAAAAVTAAAMPDYRTPGLIPKKGRHWPPGPDNGTRKPPARAFTDLPCPDHEGHTIPCRACRVESRPATAGDMEQIRAVLRAASSRRGGGVETREDTPA